jgi:flagellar hook-length control protein FliK
MAGLHLPPAREAATEGTAGTPAGELQARLAAFAQGERGEKGGAPNGHDAADAVDAAGQKRDAAALARDPKATLASAQDAAADQAQATNERAEAAPQPRFAQELQALGAAQASPVGTPTRGADAPAPAVVQMSTPATAPEFKQSLGVQVSILARDGLQQAELHLNPAEMGPISVQIAIDGTQAQVNFGADLSATRQIIESGLPELAAALRDAGFTLSGGGVHSQARGQGEGGEGPREGQGTAGAAGAGETEVTPQRTLARVSAGGVDVYA